MRIDASANLSSSLAASDSIDTNNRGSRDGLGLPPNNVPSGERRSAPAEYDSILCRVDLPAKSWVKHALDVTLAVIALVSIAPVLVVVAIAIRAETKGPILFRQKRFGQKACQFDVLKFRTMYADKGDFTGELATKPRDPRVTRVGRILRRASLDELPQLINVIRGEMSLVGPRPHAVHMRVEGVRYDSAFGKYIDRHRVKPGITGWAQVNGSRGEVRTLEVASRRLELDLQYIENWSLWLDIRILLKTAFGGFLTNYD